MVSILIARPQGPRATAARKTQLYEHPPSSYNLDFAHCILLHEAPDICVPLVHDPPPLEN